MRWSEPPRHMDIIYLSAPCSHNAGQDCAGTVAPSAAAVATLVEVAGASEGERRSQTDLAYGGVRNMRRGDVSVTWKSMRKLIWPISRTS